MDASELNKIANRKKLNANAEKLREKISKENKNILKLRVAQDTAYWDVREQLRQVESNHEKLQTNMVQVQMQHEAISGQYQEELRLRPETLNKLNSTRQICEVLEEHCERLRGTLSRCSADQAVLSQAYQRSGQVVRDIQAQHVQAEERNQLVVQGLQHEVKVCAEHITQMLQCMQFFKEEKQRADAELVDVKARLEATLIKREDLLAAGKELNMKIEQQKHELQKKEETVSGLKSDIKRLLYEFNIQGSEMKNTIVKQDEKLTEITSANESLKQALTNQESFTKTICEQNNELQEKIAALEEEQGLSDNVVKNLQRQIEDAAATTNNFKTELATMSNKKEDLDKEIIDKNQILKNADIEAQNLKLQLSVLEAEKLEVVGELNKAVDATDGLSARVQELTAAVQALENKMEETEGNLKEYSSLIQEKDKDLDCKTSTITHLMSEVKNETDARAKLDAAIQRLKREMETEKEAAAEKERKLAKQVEQLETSVRNKESELSSQMNIILELRSDKERLHNKIQSMQNKIDNIQKELTGPPPARAGVRCLPEQDDNAVMLTPTIVQGRKQTPMPRLSTPRPFAAPHSIQEPVVPMVPNFLDDSSMDDGENSLDSAEVNRRFEAITRGERLSPKPPSALKRRRRSSVPAPQAPQAPQAPTGSRPKPTNDHNPVPPAQVNDGLLKARERTFFKNKRQDKPKKSRSSDPYFQ